MAFNWLDASEAEKFGQSLAQFFIKKIPLTAENKNAKKLTKQLGAVDQMYVQLEQFKQKNTLNIYKKAKLWAAFKDELLAAGYGPELVDQVMKGLMQKL